MCVLAGITHWAILFPDIEPDVTLPLHGIHFRWTKSTNSGSNRRTVHGRRYQSQVNNWTIITLLKTTTIGRGSYNVMATQVPFPGMRTGTTQWFRFLPHPHIVRVVRAAPRLTKVTDMWSIFMKVQNLTGKISLVVDTLMEKDRRNILSWIPSQLTGTGHSNIVTNNTVILKIIHFKLMATWMYHLSVVHKCILETLNIHLPSAAEHRITNVVIWKFCNNYIYFVDINLIIYVKILQKMEETSMINDYKNGFSYTFIFY